MALTNAMVREILSKAGVDADHMADAVREIAAGNTASVEALREEIANLKQTVSAKDEELKTLTGVKKELDDLKAQVEADAKEREGKDYDKLAQEFKDYKAEIQKRDAHVAKEKAFRDILKDADIDEKYHDKIIKYSDIDSIELDADSKIKDAKEELLKEKDKLAKLKKEAQAVKAERVKELEKLSKEEAQSAKVVKNLQKNKKVYQKQLAEKKKQVVALNKEIEKIVAAAMKSQSSSSGGKKTQVDYKLAEDFVKNKGKLPWPAEGPVVGRFGKQFHPVYKNLELPPNNGIDIAVSKGTEVQAVFKGVVSQVFVMPGYNQCVLVSHGNYFTFYCKLKTVKVKAGEKVDTGEIIGKTDTINGESQLHFEVWKGKDPQNPETWLR